MHHILIAIITYRRPKLLHNTLLAINNITIPDNTQIDLLVVDNDVNQTAEQTVENLKSQLNFPVQYVAEHNKGRGFARNAALRYSKTYDYLAFVDDDVTVTPHWLVKLYDTMLQYDAQMVAGQAEYILPKNAPAWAYDCSFFLPRPVSKNGASLQKLNTGNILMDRQWIKKQAITFPNQLAGEDAIFTYDAAKKGAKLLRVPETLVTSRVEEERLSRYWVFCHAMTHGANNSEMYQYCNGTPYMALMSLYHALSLFVFAGGVLVLCAFKKRPCIRAVQHSGMAIGFITGMFRLRATLMSKAERIGYGHE